MSVLAVIMLSGWVLTAHLSAQHAKALQITVQTKQVQLKKLHSELQKTQSEKLKTQKDLDAKAKHEQDLQNQINKLNQQLQAKKEAQQTLAESIPTPQPVADAAPIVDQVQPQAYAPVSAVVSGCGDNSMANFIYMHESGCNTGSVNAEGCFGIGQDCNGIVESKCGTDYTCQNEYFTGYADSRYGDWAGAYSAWVSQGWW